jgi:hypothetical protein
LLGAQAGDYPDPWDPQVFNLIMKPYFTAAEPPTVTRGGEPF